MTNVGPKSIFHETNINFCMKTLNLSNSCQNYMSNKIFKGKEMFLRDYGDEGINIILKSLNASFFPLPNFDELRQMLLQALNNNEYDILFLFEDDMQLHPGLLGFSIIRKTKCLTKTHSIQTEAIRFMIAKNNSLAAEFLTALYLLIRKHKMESYGLVDGTPILNITEFGGYRDVYESFNFSNYITTKNGKMIPACENIQALKVFLKDLGNNEILKILSNKIQTQVLEVDYQDEMNINGDEIDMEEEEEDIDPFDSSDFGIENDVNIEDLNNFDFENEELYDDMEERHLQEQEKFIEEHKEDWKILLRKTREILGLENPNFSEVVDTMVKQLLKGGRKIKKN